MKDKKQIITIVISVLATLAVVFGLLLGIKMFENCEQGCSGESSNSANQRPEDVSIIQLIANPEKYHGKLVQVSGVGNLEFEGDYISLRKDDRKYGASKNALWISFDTDIISYEEAQQYNGKYVIVRGIFDMYDPGHGSLFSGTIKNVSRYDLWEDEEIMEDIKETSNTAE